MPAKTYKSAYLPDKVSLSAEWMEHSKTFVIIVKGDGATGITLSRKDARRLAKQIRKETKRGEA